MLVVVLIGVAGHDGFDPAFRIELRVERQDRRSQAFERGVDVGPNHLRRTPRGLGGDARIERLVVLDDLRLSMPGRPETVQAVCRGVVPGRDMGEHDPDGPARARGPRVGFVLEPSHACGQRSPRLVDAIDEVVARAP